MSITLFQIDKSGGDIFEKDYSIIIVANRDNAYGVNISKRIKDELVNQFRRGNLNINQTSEKKRKNRFRLRFHTAIVIKVLEKIIFDLGYIDDANIQVCNDFDGHFHEIKDMIFKHISKLVPNLKPEDIVQTKFHKPSFIDNMGMAFRNKDKEILKNCDEVNLDLSELIKMIRK